MYESPSAVHRAVVGALCSCRGSRDGSSAGLEGKPAEPAVFPPAGREGGDPLSGSLLSERLDETEVGGDGHSPYDRTVGWGRADEASAPAFDPGKRCGGRT